MRIRLFLSLSFLLVGAFPALAQVRPATGSDPAAMLRPEVVEILGLSVEGVENDYTKALLQQNSGLEVGERLTVPGDPALSDAIRAIYRLGMFSDVKIVEERRVGDGIFIVIQVKEEPKLADYAFEGIKKSHRKDLEKEVPLIKRSPVRTGSIERSIQVIQNFYTEKGHPLATVEVKREVNEVENTVDLTFVIDKGPKVEVGEIIIAGNEAVSERRLRKTMKTKADAWWRFWKGEKFEEDKFEEDLQRMLDYYNERGYYDAQVVRDSVYLRTDGDKPEYVVQVRIEEGSQYHIRNVDWEGNTVYKDEFLTESLGLAVGDVYNSKRLEQNLFFNQKNSDISSLYYNQGYMRFNVQPTIDVVSGDSLDLTFDIFEGDIYSFGDINIAGNLTTKEHVIRRELITVPGQTFSRDAIQESIRRLIQLNYFSQESLAPGPGIEVNDEKKSVDLAYNLEEVGNSQMELSGTWGRFGLVLQLQFTFNNFSAADMFKKGAWRPLPSGDGQRLSVGVQTNGRFYQQYSLSFSEPWFKGKPRLVGGSVSFSKISQSFLSSTNRGSLLTLSARAFYERRLKWPDNNFTSSTSLGYQFFDNDRYISTLPSNISQQVTVRQSIRRNSTNHPFFPSSGSNMELSLEVALPVADLIQYHKWRFNTNWNMPLTRKLSIGVGADYGLIGSLTGEEVEFERFVVGGSPFETSGFFSFFGKDIIYMRGYPLAALGPRSNGDPVGGRILNKYGAELRWMAIQSEQLQAAPYLFMDAANTWDGFRSYNPASLYRSAGVGARIFLPILGLVELAYGYNFDTFDPINSRHNGSQKWTFQFSLGQGFGQ